ncbi:hypothetical protein L3X38_025073 [Prunus dulcis]|uniref:Uncharacterized protein n=1 Tax=Prunus dulcis TaxID=3755 RepID=A0AAD4W120_PRUDU|nr:hypothetical protein L3X38_025073 [Prunus dulcis]
MPSRVPSNPSRPSVDEDPVYVIVCDSHCNDQGVTVWLRRAVVIRGEDDRFQRQTISLIEKAWLVSWPSDRAYYFLDWLVSPPWEGPPPIVDINLWETDA